MPGPWAGTALLLALATAATAACGHRREPWETVPLGADEVQSVRLPAAGGLVVERVRFHSRALGEPRFFVAVLPSGGAKPRDALVLNHGWRDRPEDLLRELGVAEVHAKLLAQKAVGPSVVLLPDVRFSAVYRRNQERYPYPHYLDLVAREVVDTASRAYGIPLDRDHWSVGGFSFGGYIALDVARRFPGRFASASVISGFYDRDWTYWPPGPVPPGRLDEHGRGKQTVVAPGPPPRLLLACGTGDRFISDMRDLHNLFAGRGIAHEWWTAPGGHTWAYWRSVLEPLLRFHLGPR